MFKTVYALFLQIVKMVQHLFEDGARAMFVNYFLAVALSIP